MNPIEQLKLTFHRWLGPANFSGITVSDWLRILRENDYRVDLPYVGRATVVSGLAAMNSVGRLMETQFYGKAIQDAEVKSPLFVLGCWRSGTTHLHNLIAKDERFGFPTTYHVMNPHVFLTNEWWNAPIQNLFFPKTRMMDNVRLATSEPQEDEFALSMMCGLSPMVALAFWRNRRHYNGYTTMKNASAEEIEAWKKTLLHFVKKLSVRYPDKSLVLKSPAHTAKIKLLLELFPDARFVMIHRHPYDVVVSGENMILKNLPILALQHAPTEPSERLALEVVGHYGQLFRAYFEQRALIPDGQLIEIAFSDLESKPLQTLEEVYDRLSLPEFSVAKPAVSEYLDSLAGYKKNQRKEPTGEVKSALREQWAGCFDEWQYEAN